MARTLKVAVQMDPMETINIDGDSTFALMLEAQARGHTLWHYEVRHMALKEGRSRPGAGKREERLFARGHSVKVARRHGGHFEFGPMETVDLGTMDVVLMRQ
ncbi:MAG TPA: glutathione synthase, partial [Acetobacteraceae bacterium]|nr:glutathione synthase [Acetobacteraceae bacterium]